MKNTTQWQQFFDGHAPVYMQNCFVTNTIEEVEFVVRELGLEPGARILDIGCGTGRHSVELAKRGYRMTSIDLSSGMLDEARKAANDAGVEIEFIQMNAVDIDFDPQFDGAICLCEGSLCLLGSDDDPTERDLKILRNIHAALKPGAKLIFNVLSGLRHARMYSQADVESGKYNPVTMTETSLTEWDTPEGKQSIVTRERGYVPTEIAFLCKVAGFGIEYVGGGTAGNWGKRPLDLDEFEIMVIASALK